MDLSKQVIFTLFYASNYLVSFEDQLQLSMTLSEKQLQVFNGTWSNNLVVFLHKNPLLRISQASKIWTVWGVCNQIN